MGLYCDNCKQLLLEEDGYECQDCIENEDIVVNITHKKCGENFVMMNRVTDTQSTYYQIRAQVGDKFMQRVFPKTLKGFKDAVTVYEATKVNL